MEVEFAMKRVSPLNYWSRRTCAGLISILTLMSVASLSAQELQIDEAVAVAIAGDPIVQALAAKARAWDERAIAAKQWPDPVVKVGLVNLPARSFRLRKENMTQIQLGVQQVIPRGRTLPIESERTQSLASIERAKEQDRMGQVELQTREVWLSLYYWLEARRIAKEERQALSSLIEAIESLYSSGKQNQQDLIGAELERSLVDDHLIEIDREIAASRAELAKWISTREAVRALPDVLPALPEPKPLAMIGEGLPTHPQMIAADASVRVSERAVDLAGEAYKPQFRVDLTYGFRSGADVIGRDREDFATAMLFLDVPLFTKNRQDRRLAASKYEASASRFDRTDRLRQLNRMLEMEYANWQKLGQREALFRQTISKTANQNAQAARSAYQNDLVPFADLIRAQLAEFDTKLRLVKVRVDKAKAQAVLLYLTGEAS